MTMNTTEIIQALTRLNVEAQHLQDQELDNAPDQAGRGQKAVQLTAKLQGLRAAVDSAVAADRSRLDDLWREVQRALIFVTASAAPAAAYASEAERLNSEALKLGKLAAAPHSDKVAIEKQARVLLEEIHKALAQPSGQEPEANRLLSDAMLDTIFALQGGVGPSSIRLAHEL